MEEKKGQKRPIDLSTVLDDSLQFASWDSDTELTGSPNKRPKLSENGSGDCGHSSQHHNGDVTHADAQPLPQNQFSDSPENTNCFEGKKLNGENAERRDHEIAAETSGNEVNGATDTKLIREGGDKLTDDADDSQDTVIVSEDESANGNGKAKGTCSLARNATVERVSNDCSSPAHVESGTAVCPGQICKDTSIDKDAATITSIIPDADLPVVMDCLAQHRTDPDRLNIVMTMVLDKTISPPTCPPQDCQQPSSGTKNTGADQSTCSKPASDRQEAGTHQAHGLQRGTAPRGDSQVADTSRSDSNCAVSNNSPSGDKRTAEGRDAVSSVGCGQRAKDSVGGGSSLYEDVKNVIIKIKGTIPNVGINPTEVYILLEQHQDQADRMGLVVNALLKKHGINSKQNQIASGDDIFNQAVKLNSEFPHVDPSKIYEFLENETNKGNALQTVREKLQALTGSKMDTPMSDSGASKPPVLKEDSISNDLLARDDPVFRDMRIISKMFPEKDQNELYALVEAHYYKKDRVQAVIEELLQTERNSQGGSLPHTQPSLDREPSVPATTNQAIADYLLQAEVDHLRDIFPDCDPNYIFERLEAYKGNPERIKVIVSEMFERKDYPRLKDMEEKRTMAARKRHLQNMEFTLEEFLAKFPEPGATFSATDREMKESYRNHVDVQLRHDFPDFKQSFLNQVVQTHHHHLLPIARELEGTRARILASGGRSKKLRDVPKEMALEYPETPDEYFFYELWYTLNEQRVKDHFEQQAADRQARVEEARARNELYECQCCFEDECLFEDMKACADGHLFCRLCIVRSTEAAFGEGKTQFPCLSGTCEHQIPLSVLRDLLPSAMFSKVLRKMQEEEVRQAGIPDLVECPFCSFATIMADPNNRVFRCLNPECLKDSCRLCREPNHIPLRCEEVEKQNETDMRTFIEKRVTQAMLRKCHRCGKHFVKDAGCNKMTCICGATSCYVCRTPDIDYGHFTGQNCTEADMNKLHRQEMERAAKEAREEYLRQHPEAADIDLKYDPAQHIQSGHDQRADNDDYDDDDVDGSSRSSDDSYNDSDSDLGMHHDSDRDESGDSDEDYPWLINYNY